MTGLAVAPTLAVTIVLAERRFADMGTGDIAHAVDVDAKETAQANGIERSLRTLKTLALHALVSNAHLPVHGNGAPVCDSVRSDVLHFFPISLAKVRARRIAHIDLPSRQTPAAWLTALLRVVALLPTAHLRCKLASCDQQDLQLRQGDKARRAPVQPEPMASA